MLLTSRFDKVTKEITKKCPQDSIIGLLAWTWCMDELLSKLETLETRGVSATAYADDMALIVGENNIQKLKKVPVWQSTPF